MHLLATLPGEIADGSAPVDLGQSPGDIVVLTAADSEIASLAAARRDIASYPTLRLASLLKLNHNLSVDFYVDQVIANAKLVIVRLLGGRGYWPYGVDQLVAICRARAIKLALLPGDDQPDPELAELSTLPREDAHRLWQYLVHGGPANATEFLRYAAALIGTAQDWREPAPILRAGLYFPGIAHPTLADIQRTWPQPRPVAPIIFYRALLQSSDLAPIDTLVASLDRAGLNALPIYVTSLKDAVALETLRTLLDQAPSAIILNLTGFSVSAANDPFAAIACPVLQVVLSGGTETAWRDGTRGLSARDIAMQVALPELDGRVLTRAIAFKGVRRRDDATEADEIGYVPVPDRADFVADLAASWVRLAQTPTAERRVALILANYPNRDGRIGNGVGLDTPASAVAILRALNEAGYRVANTPRDSAALMAALLAGPTNDWRALDARDSDERLQLIDYTAFFGTLPAALQKQVSERWGPPERDPFFREGTLDCGTFRIPALRFGNIVVGVQPARGYNIDPASSYHDPALVPPHNYFAFYVWLRQSFRAQVIVHVGKHGNLEWLPGKALALSQACFPEALLGPLPHLYPFIVNDPGEGTQAKRRASAVIVDHLTPPLTRAGSYGAPAALERLIDEYHEAAQQDPRRTKPIAAEIRALAQQAGIDRDCGIDASDASDTALRKLDGFLCELKELQIRDGLHIFGQSPNGALLTDLIVAIARAPRGDSAGRNASLIRALADDLALGFDPLGDDFAAPWAGARPAALSSAEPWRTTGDTVERLEALAQSLVHRTRTADAAWTRTHAVLGWIDATLRPALAACGAAEMTGLLTGLDGRAVPPGPSGAPTRGRPDVLPTGRNFFSLDTRSVPTAAAWQLGWHSAMLLLERHVQEHGQYPSAVALSAWGTSNMRTGGDDIAQALALIGARPTWDASSRRVTGFEILPLSILNRPRIDVTLRISGFFRDAFPSLIDLFDSAVRAVATLDEPPAMNPLAARVTSETAALVGNGLGETIARRRAATRIFGSQPGAYGAGLQALLDEKGWRDAGDLARAYVAWGGYAYGAGAEGEAAHGLFETRLKSVQAVLHNQDNREHDLLDSDDYYQFEGGLAATVKHISGHAPKIYHNDHSRPERPRVRTLAEEIARVVRARVVNPKWIDGVRRHGYKGAFEMAATVDYMFAFSATTGAVASHHFDAVYEAYIAADDVRAFLADANPHALAEMSERLLEAQTRGLWQPRANSAHALLEQSARRGPRPSTSSGRGSEEGRGSKDGPHPELVEGCGPGALPDRG